MSKIVEVKNVSLHYHTIENEVTALRNVNFDIEEGDFISIVGSSGCGKSTLLSLLAGLIETTYGEVIVNGERVEGVNTEVAYMLQKDHLFEWRTVYKNIVLGLELQNKLTQKNIDFVNDLIERYGLKDFANLYPRQLSGGMRQRVALIRTLATNPRVLLLDESFSALDYQTRLTICDEVWGIIKEQKKTTILVTHDIAEAVSMSDKIIVLSKRPGTVKQIFDIQFNLEKDAPMKRRESTEFNHYYKTVWKELDLSV